MADTEKLLERIRQLNKEKHELKQQIGELTRDRDLYYGLYMDIRKKWHPSPGRRPIYSKGDAAGFFIEHYYEGKPIRQIAEEHHVANSTLQRLLKIMIV